MRIHIINSNSYIELNEEITLAELSLRCGYKAKKFIAAIIDNSVTALTSVVKNECTIKFIDITDTEGYRVYSRTCEYIMFAAIYELFGKEAVTWIHHSVNNNLYCSISNIKFSENKLKSIKNKMRELINEDLPIERIPMNLENAATAMEAVGLIQRKNSLKYAKSDHLSIYKLNNYYDNMYGIMAPTTGYIEQFDLIMANDGFLLQFENPSNPGTLNAPILYPKLTQIYTEYEKWSRLMGINTVAMLNDIVSRDEIKEVILLCEALHEKKIADIASDIYKSGKRIVLIAGPSSSGKTTFAKRLSIQLRVMGLKPNIISMDNYYKSRDQILTDENGKKNFEDIEALDIELFNSNLIDILAGKEVATPIYDFALGRSGNNFVNIKLDEKSVLVIEGIHGINEQVTPKIPREEKYKIYISALIQLNLDEHNRIATTDTRLIRRMVRDHYFRGFSGISTLDMWNSVLIGEQKNIFPYQEEADVMFNSALVYELGVLKPLVEPILFNIGKDEPSYHEAKRLLSLLNNFLTINENDIPSNSLLREFIGDSIFYRTKGTQH
jgi:uridine kinase